jgi:hypothetical protein
MTTPEKTAQRRKDWRERQVLGCLAGFVAGLGFIAIAYMVGAVGFWTLDLCK